MKKILLFLVLTNLFFCFSSYGRARLIPLSEKVEKSDLIAQIKILSTETDYAVKERKPPQNQDEEYNPFNPVIKHREKKYDNIAKAKVIRSIKGLEVGTIFNLEFDNGLACPNVLYKQGDNCLIFATKMENGNYETYNTYFGKFYIEEEQVLYWPHVYPEKSFETNYVNVSVEDAILTIKRHLRNK